MVYLFCSFNSFLFFFTFFVSLCTCYATEGRIEYFFYYDRFKPFKVYGENKVYSLKYYRKISQYQTNFWEYYFNDYYNDRKSSLLVWGMYKDWDESLYTYSSVAVGTTSNVLPRFRFHNEFNYKLGKNKNTLITVGLSYIKYHNDYEDFTFIYGLSFYFDGGVLTYKRFNSNINPGGTNPSTDLFSLGLGKEKKMWLYVDYSFGNQSYLVSNLYSLPFIFDENFRFYKINYRTWITDNKGLFVEYNYLNLNRYYSKNGFMVGIFYELR